MMLIASGTHRIYPPPRLSKSRFDILEHERRNYQTDAKSQDKKRLVGEGGREGGATSYSSLPPLSIRGQFVTV